MPLPERDLGVGSGGVWTRAEALRVLSPDDVRARLRGGIWQVLRPGIYTDAGFDASPQTRAWAAVLAAGGAGRATAAGRTAARVHGMPLIDDDDRLLKRNEEATDDVAVDHYVRPRSSLNARRTPVEPSERYMIDDCPVTSPLRTLADLALVLRPDALVCAVDHALHEHLVTRQQLVELVRKLAWCRGGPALRQAVTSADARAESPLESLGRLIVMPEAPGLIPQHEVKERNGQLVGRLDFGDPVLRLGIEGDGRASHGGGEMAAKDRWRDARFTRLGWTVERYTWWEVRMRPDQLQTRIAARVEELTARRGGTGAWGLAAGR